MRNDGARRAPERARARWCACIAASVVAWAVAADVPSAALAASARSGSRVPVETDVPADSLLLGAPFRVDLRLVHAGLDQIALATPARELAPFEVVSFARSLDRGDTATVALSLRAFRVGRLVLPPLRVTARDAAGSALWAETDSAVVLVASRVPKDAKDPRDIKEAVTIRGPRALWPFLAGGAALALAGLTVWWLRRRRTKLEEIRTSRPAHELALVAIQRLAGSELARTGPWKEFYTELTTVLRNYLARRYGVNAPELTTSETLRALVPLELADDTLHGLREILVCADGVKFAKETPDPERPRRHLRDAELFVQATAVIVSAGPATVT